MASSRDDRYYPATSSRPSKSSPQGDPQCSGFFQTGQGGRTVLPPLSSAFPTSCLPVPGPFPNQYSQPRATSQARFDAQFNPSVYSQWNPPNNQNQMSSFGTYYDATTSDNRYPNYYPTYSSRTSSPVPDSGVDSDRKLPPLSTGSSGMRDERWGAHPYPVSTALPNASGGIRSPTASYPHSFSAYPTTTNSAANYPGYDMSMTDVRNPVHSQSVHQTPGSVLSADARSDSSYGRAPNQSQVTSPYGSPPPISPTSPEQEPTIKKKRKRADATQLKILNETYSRTAFPSTEERQALAKELDMSARSVQIWFQNKRQSMRQTKQSSLSTSSTGPHQSFTLSSPTTDASSEETGNYEATSASPLASHSYVPRSTQEDMTSPSLSYRRPRSGDSQRPSQWSTPRY
ncbi:homeobox-domain-containing protein [Dendrothele bispora CBS 962.96]|uniref:Homeobox-domain-containing protein n=1 Tax=Dendrothele bispora (strain CBS 962.96) TaxID=1314807 RepID=A0A4S8M054_DENBC|nr:homeobox-domain-containing protein [Dendrothele bispora CBS 962.96]